MILRSAISLSRATSLFSAKPVMPMAKVVLLSLTKIGNSWLLSRWKVNDLFFSSDSMSDWHYVKWIYLGNFLLELLDHICL